MTPITRQVLSNAFVAAVCAALFLGYTEFIAPEWVPAGTTRITISVLVLLVIGLFASFAVVGNLVVKLAILTIVPIAHWLYAGGDPAKPYVAYVVAGIELLCLWVAAAAGDYARRHKSGGVISSGE